MGYTLYNIEEVKVGDIINNPKYRDEWVEVKTIEPRLDQDLYKRKKIVNRDYYMTCKALVHPENEDGFRLFVVEQNSKIRKRII